MDRTMLYPIKPGCFKPRNDGTSRIHIQYCYNSEQKTLLDTGIEIPVNCWDKKNLIITDDLPSQFGNPKRLNNALTTQLRLVEDVITYTLRNDIADKGVFLKTFYRPDLDIYSLGSLVKRYAEEKALRSEEQEVINLDVFYQIDNYIKSKTNRVSDGMLRIYRNMKEHLTDYQKARDTTITFESFTIDFYEDFVDFLSYDIYNVVKKVESLD